MPNFPNLTLLIRLPYFYNFYLGRKYAMLKLKIILSTILRNFRVHSDLSEEDFKLQADIILKREEGFQVRLEPRQRKAKVQ